LNIAFALQHLSVFSALRGWLRGVIVLPQSRLDPLEPAVSPAQHFAALFANPAHMPTVPKVVQQLIQSFSRDDVSVDEIASMLAADPVLSAKTLRLANSAYFHVSRSIGTVDDALRMLGFVMVRNLVVGCGVTSAFKPMPGVDLPQFWRYSLHTACARALGGPAPPARTPTWLSWGLMHGLGQLLMHVVQPDRMKALDANARAGRRATPRLSCPPSATTLPKSAPNWPLRWKFPEDVTEPLRTARLPLQAEPASALAAVLHIAMWRARVEALEAQQRRGQARAARAKWLNRWPAAGVAARPGHVWGGTTRRWKNPMPPLAELCEGTGEHAGLSAVSGRKAAWTAWTAWTQIGRFAMWPGTCAPASACDSRQDGGWSG
jgi:HD-like signal output (HDOD) protein